jgi:hypothetical protein
LQSQKLVVNVNEIWKDIKKVDRDYANPAYNTHITIKQLTQNFNRIIIVSGRNIYECGEETNE